MNARFVTEGHPIHDNDIAFLHVNDSSVIVGNDCGHQWGLAPLSAQRIRTSDQRAVRKLKFGGCGQYQLRAAFISQCEVKRSESLFRLLLLLSCAPPKPFP